MVSRLHRALLRDLWHLRSQVVAAALVLACGLAAFVTMLSTYHSLVDARTEYYAEYRFADVFAHLRRAPEALGAQLRSIPGVAAIETRIVEDVTLSVPGLAEPAVGRIISVAATRRPMLNDLSVRQGRYISADGPDEVVVSETFARANSLNVGDQIGAVLNGRWRNLRVVGLALSPEYVYEVSPAMIFPDNRRFGVMWMNRDSLAGAFDMRGAFNDIALTLMKGASESDVLQALDRALRQYGGLSAYGRADQPSNRFLSDELGEIEVNATYLPAIFLAVSVFLLYTLLSRLVSMQRGQIGLLKAFGYSNARVGRHFLEFALLLVTVGLAAGIGMGVYLGGGMVEIYRQYFHFPALQFRLPVSVTTATIAIAAAAAVLGSLTAVARAVRLSPAEAMRPEAPKNYRAGLLESMGAAQWIGASGRVIARNIARRPWRAALSVGGISAAVATVVLGRFTFDAVNHLVAAHFDSAQRDDVTILFRETRPAAIVHEIERLPGVMRAEPFRTVPVWFRLGHRQKRAAIFGMSSDMDLKQLVDSKSRRIDMPPAGLVLTRKLAQILGAHPGDLIAVEQLEGRRRQFSEPLAALSDEPLGISGYMDLRALSRVLGEDGEVSGALLEIDRSKDDELYETLKGTPVVAAVAIRTAMLQSIRDTMNRSFILMPMVMTAFAAVLVVAVIYNSARIALSERGSELASLRVLGFSNAEVTLLLLGEQAILTLVAIPVGFGLGTAICRMLIPVFDRELFRLPFVLTAGTFGYAALVTLVSAILSGSLVVRRILRLDLIAVLKSRE